MKSNFNKIFEQFLPSFLASSDINIEDVLDEMMPLIRYEDRVTKKDLSRSYIRGKLTSAFNQKQIYSFREDGVGEVGHFVFIENANESQLRYFLEKAEKDKRAALSRHANAEERLHQISMAWDENNNFIGYHIPDAVNL